MRRQGHEITVLVSEYVEGELLSDFLQRFPGKRLLPFQGLHLLYALTKGMEPIHLLNEYHGDLHSDNIIVNRFGLEFELKLLDMFSLGGLTDGKSSGRYLRLDQGVSRGAGRRATLRASTGGGKAHLLRAEEQPDFSRNSAPFPSYANIWKP